MTKSGLLCAIMGLIAGMWLAIGVNAGPVTVNVTSEQSPIKMISGGQFEFFSPPIRQRKNDENLLNSWKSVPMQMLRYPGGTWADHYIWKDPSAGYFVVGNSKSVITPTQFIEMCRKINAEPIFQVNTLSVNSTADRINPTDINAIRRGAQNAADWVRDANIVKKWNVKYWEIGNEVWIWLFPEEYARYVVEYSKAMKKVDPSIKIIACGLDAKVGPFDPHGFFDFSKTDSNWKPRKVVVNDPKTWTETLLREADGHFDYLAAHPYMSATKRDNPRSIYLQTTAGIFHNEKLKTQYDALNRFPQSKVRIAVTEWACNFGTSVPGSSGKIPPEKGYFYTLGNGINMGYYFGRFLEDSRNEISIVHSLCDTQTLYYWAKKELAKGAPLDHPSILSLRLWYKYLGTQRMKVQVGNMPKMRVGNEDIPALFVFASEDDMARYLVVINLDPDKPYAVKWNRAGKSVISSSIMSGKDISTNNFGDWDKEEKSVAIKDFSVTAQNGICDMEIPPISMVGIKFAK